MISLYIHFPWCMSRCHYCDFNAHGLSGRALPESTYLDALIQALAHPPRQVETISTIFMGGGTPSLFSGSSLKKVLDYVRDHYRLAADCEITIEANPGSVAPDQLADYLSAGINRISIGVQVSIPRVWYLGRKHHSKMLKLQLTMLMQLV